MPFRSALAKFPPESGHPPPEWGFFGGFWRISNHPHPHPHAHPHFVFLRDEDEDELRGRGEFFTASASSW